jgi:hypothetical protein
LGTDLVIEQDKVSRNGITYTKAELAKRVSEALTAETEMHCEFAQRFLVPVEAALQLSKG